jgi:Pro-kumamolisin, activation domain/Bacterial Ig-like domain (group 3)
MPIRSASFKPCYAFAVVVFILVCCLPTPASTQTVPEALITRPIDPLHRTTLRGNVHPFARSKFDRGEAAPDRPLTRMVLVLKRSAAQDKELQRLIEDQQSKDSTEYHHWLTPDEIAARFGPAESDVSAVKGWLESSGFQVTTTSRSRMFIEFSGTAALLKQAFGTAMHRYVVNGVEHWANASDPTIPAALGPVVAGVDSLHDFRRQAANHLVGRYSATEHKLIGEAPDFTINEGNNNPEYALVPFDFAAIYDLLPLWNATPTPITGAGQTIAIVARTDITPTDTTSFWQQYGLDGTHAPQPTLNMIYNGPNPGINSDEAEGDIDSQWSGAAAPGATIDMVVSGSTETTDGVDLSALYIVDNNLAPILSESYGACEAVMGTAGTAFYNALWEQAAAQGISVFVAAGDNGAAGCDDPSGPAQYGLAVNGIASTRFNAAVGGTDFNQFRTWSTYWNSTNASVTSASAKGYIPETTWNDSCTNALVQYATGGSTDPEANCNSAALSTFLVSDGAGGGRSQAWMKPAWQTSTPSDNARDLPDVSLFSGNGLVGSYYLICQSQDSSAPCAGLLGYGGTSVATPAFAGIMALVNQKTGAAQGVPGLVLYKLAAHQPSAFHDIATGTISMPCVSGSLNCNTYTKGDTYGLLSGYGALAGYDLATGLGSVDAANLVNNWNSISFTPSTTTMTLNGGAAVTVKHGTAVPVAMQVNPSAATGNAALLVSPGTPGDPGLAMFPLSNGAVNSSTTLLPGGSYSVLSHYGGDTNYGGSYSNAVPVTVTAEGSKTYADLITLDITGKVLSYGATSATYGSGYALLRVDVGDSNSSYSPSGGIASTCSTGSASCATGSISLAASGTSLDGTTLALNIKGNAETVPLVPGTYAVSANYGGDASYGPSAGNTSFTIAKAPVQITASYLQTPVQYGDLEEIDGYLVTSSNGIAPTGTFQFFVDGSPYGNPISNFASNGFTPQSTQPYAKANAQAITYFLAIGNHTLSVQYSGDANYAGGTSASIQVPVTQAQPDIVAFSWGASSAFIGQTVTASMALMGSGFGVEPTGTFTFYDNGQPIPGPVTLTPDLSNDLTARVSYTFTTTGSHSLTASYSGDSNYLPVNQITPDVLNVQGPVSVVANGGITIAKPGLSGSTTLTLTPNNSFSGAVSLSCTTPPLAVESSCSLSSGTTSGSTIQVNVGGAPTQINLSISTSAATSSASKMPPRIGDKANPLLLAGLLAFCLPLFRRRRSALFSVFLLLALSLSLAACGGGGGAGTGGGGSSSEPGTPAGAYQYTVSAITGTGTTAITSTSTVSVLVQ